MNKLRFWKPYASITQRPYCYHVLHNIDPQKLVFDLIRTYGWHILKLVILPLPMKLSNTASPMRCTVWSGYSIGKIMIWGTALLDWQRGNMLSLIIILRAGERKRLGHSWRSEFSNWWGDYMPVRCKLTQHGVLSIRATVIFNLLTRSFSYVGHTTSNVLSKNLQWTVYRAIQHIAGPHGQNIILMVLVYTMLFSNRLELIRIQIPTNCIKIHTFITN